ncbi:MAG: OmpA family protein [bacterium]|nr:OmpA family protein [bacterium]
MKIKIYFLFPLMYLFFIIMLPAKNTSARFLKLTSSAKLASMAEAGTALKDADIATAEKNPAAIFWLITNRLPEMEIIDPEVIEIEDLDLEIDNPSMRKFYKNPEEVYENDEYYVKNRRIKISLIRKEQQYYFRDLAVIYFHFNQSNIEDEYFDKLNALAEFLNRRDEYKVLLESFTDEIGNNENNQLLATKRAGAVIEYLLAKTIAPETFKEVIYGKEQQLSYEKIKGYQNIKLAKVGKESLIEAQVVDQEGDSKVVDVLVTPFIGTDDVIKNADIEEKEDLPKNIHEIASNIKSTAQQFKYGREKVKFKKQKNHEIMMAHNEWFADVNCDYFGYLRVLRDKGLVLASSVKYLSIVDIKKRDSIGQNLGMFGSYSTVFSFTASKVFLQERLGLAATLKFVRESIDDKSDTVLATDFGFIYRFNNIYSFSSSFLNLADDGLKLYEEEFDLPRTYILGVAKHGEKINLAFDIENEINGDEFYRLGSEYFLLKKFFILRGGYRYSAKSYDNLGISLGFGLNFFKSLKIDYAYVPFDDLEDTHRFSLRWIL